jgi:general stress protein YciG
MGGTISGGKKASETNKARYGSDFHKVIGRKGGETSNGGGHWFKWLKENDPERFMEICRRGGKNGKRT